MRVRFRSEDCLYPVPFAVLLVVPIIRAHMPEVYEGIGNDGATRCRASLHASVLVRRHSLGGPVLVLESRSSMAATCWRLTWADMSYQGFLFHVKRSGDL